jgi:hypothetical protein
MFFGPGDVIGFSGRGFVSDLINVATFGVPRIGLSHVAIVVPGGLVFESTTLAPEPCVFQHRKVDGVQAHWIDQRIAGYDGKVFHYPLTERLFNFQSTELLNFLTSLLGTTYDAIAAIRSAGRKFSWVESRLHPENLHSIFCSEMVAAAHRKVGLFHTENVARWSPNMLVRTEQREGILGKPVRLK